jgi:hypothetical protein
MASTAKRPLALPATLSRDLNRLARRRGKSTIAVLQDLVMENRQNHLAQEFRDLQGYWSKKARAKGVLTTRDLKRYLAKP